VLKHTFIAMLLENEWLIHQSKKPNWVGDPKVSKLTDTSQTTSKKIMSEKDSIKRFLSIRNFIFVI
jgi:hypothetical protein